MEAGLGGSSRLDTSSKRVLTALGCCGMGCFGAISLAKGHLQFTVLVLDPQINVLAPSIRDRICRGTGLLWRCQFG
jgi:hypothetical protein